MKTFHASELFQAQERIFACLKQEESKLEAIRNSDAPLIHKWQKFLEVILPIQIEAVKNLGCGSDQAALANFNEQFMRRSAQDPALRELNEQKWIFLFEKAFDLKELKQISLEQASLLIADIASAMSSEPFLQEIDRAVEPLSDQASLLERRQRLLTVLFPLHRSVMEKHGFDGELGYIQAQRALMDYYSDPFIMEQSKKAQSIVFQRAKLIPK